jgi:hypothetical protein
MRVFRRLNYGFAQARNRSPIPASCSGSGIPGMSSIETSADPPSNCTLKGKPRQGARVWFKVVGMHMYPRHL